MIFVNIEIQMSLLTVIVAESRHSACFLSFAFILRFLLLDNLLLVLLGGGGGGP